MRILHSQEAEWAQRGRDWQEPLKRFSRILRRSHSREVGGRNVKERRGDRPPGQIWRRARRARRAPLSLRLSHQLAELQLRQMSRQASFSTPGGQRTAPYSTQRGSSAVPSAYKQQPGRGVGSSNGAHVSLRSMARAKWARTFGGREFLIRAGRTRALG